MIILNTNSNIYQKYIFIYGIISLLFVLEYFESIESYEECEKIIESIKKQENLLKTNLFTKITIKNTKKVIEEYNKFGLTGKNLIENSKYYSSIIIKEVQNL